jgi:predicted ATP-binding protein involved in virulence
MSEANNFVADFYEKPAIVIIDEIDTYLHPKWQRNILNVLAKTFVNTRFIVTTHSPLVANHLEVEDKTVFVIKEGGEVEEITNIYGQGLESAFNKTANIEDSGRPKKVQKALEELFDLIDEYTDESMAKAEEKITALSKIIDKDDSDLVQAKTYLELYK